MLLLLLLLLLLVSNHEGAQSRSSSPPRTHATRHSLTHPSAPSAHGHHHQTFALSAVLATTATANVRDFTSAVRAGARTTTLPTVFMHGMGDSCFNSGMESITKAVGTHTGQVRDRRAGCCCCCCCCCCCLLACCDAPPATTHLALGRQHSLVIFGFTPPRPSGLAPRQRPGEEAVENLSPEGLLLLPLLLLLLLLPCSLPCSEAHPRSLSLLYILPHYYSTPCASPPAPRAPRTRPTRSS